MSVASSSHGWPVAPPDRDLVALALAVRRLNAVSSLMNVGAHPDDELSALLAYCSLGLGVRTVSVIATRGEGGQNLLGPERDQVLGVLRTREMEEAARITGVRVRFLGEDLDDPLRDFGFSRDPDETLERWGAERALERLVRVLREERPDVVVTSFRDEYGQHGHHRAMTRLTMQAVRLAADPGAFAHHRQHGLEPWAVRKVYVPAHPHEVDGDVYLSTEAGEPTVVVDVGMVDDLMGLSYLELGERSRRLHMSQGMGRPVLPGPHPVYAELVYRAPELAGADDGDLFAGLPRTVGDLACLVPGEWGALAEALRRIQDGIDAMAGALPRREEVLRLVHRTLADVRVALGLLEGLNGPLAADIRSRLSVKQRQLTEASAIAALLAVSLQAEHQEVVRGQSVSIEVRAHNGGRRSLERIHLVLEGPPGWRVQAGTGGALPPAGEAPPSLGPHEEIRETFRLAVPENAPYCHPYRTCSVTATVRYEVDGVEAAVPVELPDGLAVLPLLSLEVEPEALLLDTQTSRRPLHLAVAVRNRGDREVDAAVRLEVPEGWEVSPSRSTVRVGIGQVSSLPFVIEAPTDVHPGRYRLRAVAEVGDGTFDSTVQVVDYPHVGRAHLLRDAVATVVALPLRIAPVRVGYVDGGFDAGAAHLRRMGFDVTSLGEADLLWGDLARYDTIVVGIYAYGRREDLRAANQRLLEFVRQGGHLIVQLHRPQDRWDPDVLPPSRLRIGRPSFEWRVTDPAAPVTILQPSHPIFNWPNPIGPDDWLGWVKERGLYFPMEWGPEYTPLVATGDRGRPELRGGMLLARRGKGTYLYTSLAWHYQLDHHVPGAYRIVANMVSLPACEREAGLRPVREGA